MTSSSPRLRDLSILEIVGRRLLPSHPLFDQLLPDSYRDNSGAGASRGSSCRVVEELLDLQSTRSPNQTGDFLLLSRLGSGSFADVWLAQSVLSPRNFFAVKRTTKFIDRIAAGASSSSSSVESEAELLGRVPEHRHVCRCVGCYETEHHCLAVFELGEGGTLEPFLQDPQPQAALGGQSQRSRRIAGEISAIPSFGEASLACLLGQILCGLCHLHAHQIIHRDIKPANILLRRAADISASENTIAAGGVEAFLCDFGVSVASKKGSDVTVGHDEDRTVIGTRAFAAPELLKHWGVSSKAPYSALSDVWSLGSILYCYVLMGHVGCGLATRLDYVIHVIEGRYPSLTSISQWRSATSSTGSASLHDMALAAGDDSSVLVQLERLIFGQAAATTTDDDFTATMNAASFMSSFSDRINGGTSNFGRRRDVVELVMSRVRDSYSLPFLQLVDAMMVAEPNARITAVEALRLCGELDAVVPQPVLKFRELCSHDQSETYYTLCSTSRASTSARSDMNSSAGTQGAVHVQYLQRIPSGKGALTAHANQRQVIVARLDVGLGVSRLGLQRQLAWMFARPGVDAYLHSLFPVVLEDEQRKSLFVTCSRGADWIGSSFDQGTNFWQNPSATQNVISAHRSTVSSLRAFIQRHRMMSSSSSSSLEQSLLHQVGQAIRWWNSAMDDFDIQSGSHVRRPEVVLEASDLVVLSAQLPSGFAARLLPTACCHKISEDKTVGHIAATLRCL